MRKNDNNLWDADANYKVMIDIRRDVCGYCGACVSVCPHGSLELIDAYLTVDAATCKDKCKICAIVCPLGAIEKVE